MKITIKYEYDGQDSSPYWARAWNDDKMVQCACGSSFDAAKDRLLEKLKNISSTPVPSDEVIVI